MIGNQSWLVEDCGQRTSISSGVYFITGFQNRQELLSCNEDKNLTTTARKDVKNGSGYVIIIIYILCIDFVIGGN